MPKRARNAKKRFCDLGEFDLAKKSFGFVRYELKDFFEANILQNSQPNKFEKIIFSPTLLLLLEKMERSQYFFKAKIWRIYFIFFFLDKSFLKKRIKIFFHCIKILFWA